MVGYRLFPLALPMPELLEDVNRNKQQNQTIHSPNTHKENS